MKVLNKQMMMYFWKIRYNDTIECDVIGNIVIMENESQIKRLPSAIF